MRPNAFNDVLFDFPRGIAGQLIDGLEADLPVPDRRRWKAEDYHSLTYVALLDRSVENGEFAQAVEGERRSLLLGQVATFHSALPFAEMERKLIADEYDEWKFPDGLRDDVLNRVPRQKICVEGIVRATSGRELMRRWWSWRRGIDEYEGGDGIEAARTAIDAVYEHLAAS